ncbi:class I SAM-dependent methyltransferase [Myroides phaeus]|uniref:Methyltransferase domain-containing protein n=1 Tax=Myroides phaeus TaxID=702745 RepID=A0A1G8CP98_9FLAO|nr:class I SAM-dependent methyltransferase [Myroides phaeus]MEC4117427.1 class I SAM-dependent methyltransferase [Myroides phaeus]SDH47246.1 Methyltransferase domain-containing protein [Myroides phaeus]
MTSNEKAHWEEVYKSKTPEQVSWTQIKPVHSLQFIENSKLPKEAKIIDIGGGDSNLVDFLLEQGYTDITVMDISKNALLRAQARLGERAKQVKWIESNVVDFKPTEKYAIWHDRAVFHFLTTPQDIAAYQAIVNESVTDALVVATFSKNGPLRCSGLDIKQYNSEDLTAVFAEKFTLNNSLYDDHITPFDTKQNFVYCQFNKNKK